MENTLSGSYSPSLVPAMSSPVPVTILSLTPGAGAVLFRIEEGVEGRVTPSGRVTPTLTEQFYWKISRMFRDTHSGMTSYPLVITLVSVSK